MKQTLRMFCMGLAATASLGSFAQEAQDFTQKLWNYDFEKGPHGWTVNGESADQNFSVWMPQIKGDVKSPGYYGHNNLALEIWQSSGTLKDNSLSQTVTDLPNGTYVFGAYMMATDQSNTENRELIEGVYMFANGDSIPVATNRVEAAPDAIWSHSAKFNVATVVEDGTLKVGVKCIATNINFTTIDNATLYYFGDMDAATALNEMAKIDIQRSLAIADTCANMKAAADSVAYLSEKIEAAKSLTSADQLYLADEELGWGMRLVRKSAKDYASFASAIATAKEIAAKEWSEYVADDLAALNALIDEAEAAYEAGTVSRVEINAMKTSLAEAASIVELDGIYTLLEIYTERVDSIRDYEGEEIGEYSSEMIENAEDCLDDINFELSLTGEVSATDIKNNCDVLFERIQDIIDNPLNYSEFPIFLHRGETLLPNQGTGDRNKAYKVLDGAYVEDIPAGTNNDGGSYGARPGVIHYNSPLFRFRETLTKVRFIVHEVGADFQTAQDGRASFCLGSFAMFDENGNAIELTTDNLITNANEPKEGKGIAGLLDGDPGTFMHSLWSGSTPQAHYLEVILPEGEYSAFSFQMVALSQNHSRAFPAEVEITYVSDLVTELQQTIVAARTNHNPIQGTAPGFYNFDLTPYITALAEGDAIAEKNGALDAEAKQAIDKVNAAVAEIEEKGCLLPEAGKKYRIVSSEPHFVKNQLVHKAMTINDEDTTYTNWLWWEDASKDSVNQEFSFEFIGEEEEKLFYNIKHEATGLYLADWRDEDGQRPSAGVFTLSEKADSFEVRHIGAGEWIFVRHGYGNGIFHMLNHNSGVADPNAAAQSGVGKGKGIRSSIIIWNNAAYDNSGFYIREMMELPCATKSITDLTFNSQTYTIYDGINTMTLTADKECAFEGLTFTSGWGLNIAPESVSVEGNVATVIFTDAIGEFQFSFNNAEGVEEVVVDGNWEFHGVNPKFTELETAYNNAVNKLVVKGTEVGQVADTKEFDDALMNAQALLENGADDEALVAAKIAIDSAVAHLVYNLPVAGQEYFIQSALPWMTRWNSEMDVFVKSDDIAYWGYVNINDMSHRWKFVDCGQLKNGMPAYYLENVGTQLYLTTPRLEENPNANGGRLYVVEDTTEAASFNIHFLTDGKVGIADSREGNANGSWCLHPMNHQTGTGYVAHSYMITWGKHDAASAMRVVRSEKVISDFLTGIEDVEVVDEYVAPVQKGIYDLYGRRIETPAATGIYIVDGKKRVIKK